MNSEKSPSRALVTVEHKQLVAPWVEPANEQNLERLQREIAGVNKSGAAQLKR